MGSGGAVATGVKMSRRKKKKEEEEEEWATATEAGGISKRGICRIRIERD